MKQTIYVDILVSINVLTDYFLLYATAVIAGRKKDRIRLCLASVIGALGSLLILLPHLPSVLNIIFTLAISIIMTLTAFGITGFAAFFRSVFTLYTLSAGYSGIMLVIWQLSGSSRLSVNNGFVYIDIDSELLVLTTILLYAVISFFSGRIRSKNLLRSRCVISIIENGCSVELDGLIDTGNTLTEPFSGFPVIVAGVKQLKETVPPSIIDYFACGKPPTPSEHRIRIVPFSSAGGSGSYIAYRPHKICINMTGKNYNVSNVYLAVSERHSGPVIVNPDALNI